MINPDLAIYLLVTGYGDDADSVDALLGLAPTAVWRRGEPFSSTFPEARRLRSQWMLASGLPVDAGFGDHCRALLALLEPRADAVVAAAARWHLSLVVGHFFHHGDPALYLDEDIVARFAALGLDASFDQVAYRPGHGTPLYREPGDPDRIPIEDDEEPPA